MVFCRVPGAGVVPAIGTGLAIGRGDDNQALNQALTFRHCNELAALRVKSAVHSTVVAAQAEMAKFSGAEHVHLRKTQGPQY
jgi:hypothetical protein